MDVQLLLQKWETALSAENKASLRKALALDLNELLLHDFEKLVQLLYRVDVPEQKLRTVLAENTGKDAGELLADLLIKRQEEKTALRRSFPPAKNISEDERW
jgi:hypothetical protein